MNLTSLLKLHRLHSLMNTKPSLPAALALLLCGTPATLHATDYTVNDLTDTTPALGVGSGTTGDLRYCLRRANSGATGSSHTIAFSAGLTGTITLSGHELVMNTNLAINGPGAENLTISGGNASRVFYIAPARTVTISGLTLTGGNGFGNDATGIDPGGIGYDETGGGILNDRGTLTLNACTISNNVPKPSATLTGGGIYNRARDANARLTMNNCTVTGNTANSGYPGGGGGIFNYAFSGTATLEVNDSLISSNTARGGSYGGGGITNFGLGSPANASISRCTVSGNTSDGFNGGGGIYSTGESGGASSSMSITSSVITGNSLTGNSRAGGAGVLNGSGGGPTDTMTLRNCTVSGNTSNKEGGGISNYGWLSTARLTLSNCTVHGNTAATSGAGIFNHADQGTGTLKVDNSTIAGNSAAQRGGGIYNHDETNYDSYTAVTVTNSTISGNSAPTGGAGIANVKPQGGVSTATVTLNNTILALHPVGANYGTAYGTGISGGFNLSDDFTCTAFLTAASDKNETAAGLQEDGGGNPLLQDNGGSTQTIALLPGSVAIDAGKAANDPLPPGQPVSVDQRSYSRPFDDPAVANAAGSDGSDIGAFEAGSSPAPVTTELFARGSSWKYLAPLTAAPALAWRGPGFAETGWSSGNAEIGYGDGGEATVIPTTPTTKPFTVYFRKTFTVADPAAFASLTLSLLRDDGAVVYLNGVEVWRSNMPGMTPITYATPASTSVGTVPADELTFYTRLIEPGLLIAGTNANVLAVEVHQYEAASSDISFNAGLVATLGNPDTDADGMPDAWESASFGNLAQTADGDNDGDGRSNLSEWKARTNPLSARDIFAITSVTANASRQTTLIWPTVPGVSYRVQRSTATSGWGPLGSVFAGDGIARSFTDTTPPAGAPRLLYRVVVP